MAGRTLLVRLVIALLRVTGEAGRAHRTDRRSALALMASRRCASRRMQGAGVRLAGSRMTRSAIPFVRVMLAVAGRTRAIDGSLPRIRMTTGAFEPRVLIVRESQRS